ncbi:MAG: hypothetical protein LBC59_01280, partial [Chitinispirillales bacterium]|nr:hypothetical protein [Chitinispirillales bacterium]
MPDFEGVYPLSGGNRGLTPAVATPTAPVKPLPAVRLWELRDRWIDALDLSRLSVDIYKSATKQFIIWLEKNEAENIRKEDILAYKRHMEESDKRPTTVKLYIV